MVCIKCGAEFDNVDSKCPFCGALNVEGALKEYDEQLGELKDELEELADDSYTGYKNRFKSFFKYIVIVLGIAVLFIGMLIWYSGNKQVEEATADDMAAINSYRWRCDYFPIVNELYNKGDYEAVLIFMEEHRYDVGYDLSYWDHFYIMSLYRSYDDFLKNKDDIYDKNGNIVKYALNSLIHSMYEVDSFRERIGQKLTDDEIKHAEEWRQDVRQYYKEYLGMDDGDVEDMYGRICYSDGYGVSYSKLSEYIDEVYGVN